MGWQREVAEDVVTGHGVIVSEFFDAGCSRRLEWADRPQAAALLAEVQGTDCRFDAIVVGEYERAFCGDQYQRIAPWLRRHGLQVWLPEAHGPIELNNPTHQALIMLLRAQSGREVARSRHRTLAGTLAQACVQGRYLGGRPYGYRLVDPARTRIGRMPGGASAAQTVADPASAPDEEEGRWIPYGSQHD
ncbi:MAG: recombinase family protein, partial [Haloechinothrix sp.]